MHASGMIVGEEELIEETEPGPSQYIHEVIVLFYCWFDCRKKLYCMNSLRFSLVTFIVSAGGNA